jgi:hypothetical protein
MPIPWLALATLGSGLFGSLFGGNDLELPPEQRRLLDAQRQATETENALQQILLARRRQQDPLFQALQQMSFSRLPIFARQGIEPPNFGGGQPTLPKRPRPVRDDSERLDRAIPR